METLVKDLDRQRALSEAADWLARLCADDRTSADEDGLRAWLALDPAHGQAFDHVTHVWELAGSIAPDALASTATRRSAWPRRLAFGGLAAVLLLAAVAAVVGLTA